MSFSNSITYSEETGYNVRSTGSEFNFNYSGTYLAFRCEVTTGSGTATIYILEDGALTQTITVTDSTLNQVTLSSGNKYVQLIESSVGTSSLVGGFLKSIILEPSKYSKVNQGSLVEELVFLGNSVTQGVGSGSAGLLGYAQLFKSIDSKPVTTLGYSAGTLQEMASDSGKIATTVGWITDAFANTTTTKTLTIMLGTNDYGLDSTAALTFIGWYEDLLDAINTADSSIVIYCITPTIRTDDGALLDSYRTDITTLCGTKAFATAIDGKSILTVGDLSDTVHPDAGGHVKIHDAIDGIIL